MPKYIIEGDTAELFAIEVDWSARKVLLHGLAGDNLNALSVEGLEKLVATSSEDREIISCVVWKENADGKMEIQGRDLADIQAGIAESAALGFVN